MSLLNKESQVDHHKDHLCLEPILQKSFGDKFRVIDYSIDKLVPIGENFGSNISKITAKVRWAENLPIEELQIVAKKIVSSKFDVDWTKIFKKEISMYNAIIPLYKMIESKNGIDEENSIGKCVPLLYGHRISLDPGVDTANMDAIILLENLNVLGYYVADKKKGLDIRHATYAIKALARFHAFGIVAQNKYPVEFENATNESLYSGFDYHVLDSMFDNFLSLVQSTEQLSKYSETVQKMVTRHKEGSKSDKTKHGVWTTICHNDFWTNNMLFHSDEEGNIDAVKFVDFQTYMLADVFVDLAYFLSTSLNDDAKLNNFDELLDAYHETFLSVIRKSGMNVNEFSRERFDERFREVAKTEFLHSAIALNFFTAEVDKDSEDHEDLLLSLMSCKGNELFFTKMIQLFRIYEDRDWLD